SSDLLDVDRVARQIEVGLERGLEHVGQLERIAVERRQVVLREPRHLHGRQHLGRGAGRSGGRDGVLGGGGLGARSRRVLRGGRGGEQEQSGDVREKLHGKPRGRVQRSPSS